MNVMQTSLIASLRSLPPGILLDDGARTWDVDNLIDAIFDAAIHDDLTDDRDYVVGADEDGSIWVTALNEGGYLTCVPAFREIRNGN